MNLSERRGSWSVRSACTPHTSLTSTTAGYAVKESKDQRPMAKCVDRVDMVGPVSSVQTDGWHNDKIFV